MQRLIIAVACLTVPAACSDRKLRYVGNINDPLCAPDGSVVYVQYATDKGNFPAHASRASRSWYGG